MYKHVFMCSCMYVYTDTYASGGRTGGPGHESRTWWGKTLSVHSDVFPLRGSATGLHRQ